MAEQLAAEQLAAAQLAAAPLEVEEELAEVVAAAKLLGKNFLETTRITLIFRKPATAEDLDSEMDAYMLKTKGGLDAQMDEYMSKTKVLN